jgi:Family of unknown function (DUF6527)
MSDLADSTTVFSEDPPIDIGHGVAIQARRVDGKIGGFAWWHPCTDGRRAEGYANTEPVGPDPGWELVSESPVTLTPSLLCTACKFHGLITDGRWVPV